MLYWLTELSDGGDIFNLFRYITFRAGAAFFTALIFGFLFGRPLINLLRARQKNGQPIRADGPEGHLETKAGTPTMGGALILGGLTVSTLLWARLDNPFVWIVLGVTLTYGLIGFIDDFSKLRRGQARGLTAREKMAAQVGVAFVAAMALYAMPETSTELHVPFFKDIHPDLGWLYVPFAVLVLVGASNAVNLTDGLDGLAIGPVMTTAFPYWIFADVSGNSRLAAYLQLPYVPGAGELAIFCGALLCAGLGFLWFNAYPAMMFMGDVGSLPLGAALGLVALVTKQELVLVIAGGVFVVEALSVIFQVASFKLRSKRVFRMAPIHHHFELAGWPEPQIIVRFWIISIVCAVLALSTLKLR